MTQTKKHSLDLYKTIFFFLYINQVILFYLEVSIIFLENNDRINHLLPYDKKIQP